MKKQHSRYSTAPTFLPPIPNKKITKKIRLELLKSDIFYLNLPITICNKFIFEKLFKNDFSIIKLKIIFFVTKNNLFVTKNNLFATKNNLFINFQKKIVY